MNPEFVRNKWLELSPLRLWALPLVVLALVIVANAFDKDAGPTGFSWVGARLLGITVYGVFAAWGAYQAAQCVTGEVVGGTWDRQLLAQHRPWELLVGKLFGSTVYAWLGVGLGLLLYAVGAAASVPPGAIARDVVLLTLGVTWLHALGLFGSLASATALRAVRRPTTQRARQPAVIFALVMLVVTLAPPMFQALAGGHLADARVAWWGPLPTPSFMALSFAMFLFWTLIGAHRLLRAELQEPVGPLGWIGFLAFLTAYAAPFVLGEKDLGVVHPGAAIAALQAFICAALFYPLLLAERKDLVLARSLAAAWRRADAQGVWTRLPLWTFNLLGFGLGLAALIGFGVLQPTATHATLVGVAASFGLFMLRDLAWVLAVHLAPAPGRRPDLVVWFFLAVLYVLGPLVLVALGEVVGPAAFLLLPAMAMAKADPASLAQAGEAVLWAMPGAAVAWAIAWARLRRTFTG